MSVVINALTALHQVTMDAHSTLALQPTLDAIAGGVAKAAGFRVAAVNLLTDDGHFEVVSVEGTDDIREELLGAREPADNIYRLERLAERWGGLLFLSADRDINGVLQSSWTPTEAMGVPGEWHVDDILFAPVRAPTSEWLGILSVDLPVSGGRPSLIQCKMMELFADQAAVAILNARVHAELVANRRQLAHTATHDQLTQVGNRTLLSDFIAIEASADTVVAAVAIDLDGFKAINDRCGHATGDEVLQVVAARLVQAVRSTDVVIRMGGDEFLIMLCHPWQAGDAEITALLSRLRSSIEQPIVTRADTLQIRGCVGVSRRSARKPLDDLIATADRLMYAEKALRVPQQGR